MNILVAGDFCDKNRVSDLICIKSFKLLFKDIESVVKMADYSIVNFEFPIVLDKERARQIPKCGPNLQGTIGAIDAIRYAGFRCCTLANNHILDQGEQCCIDTKVSLELAGIDTVGVGHNLSEASNTFYKVINGETIAIINCCEHEFTIATDTSAGANPMNPVRQYYAIQKARKRADHVLVIVHGGHELFQLPSPRMQETYRFFIDAGADVVVNHHQHCFSGYEVYNGKPIFYGLGNFCFDNPKSRNGIWNEGYMVVISFEQQKIGFELIPYTQCNEKPSVELVKDRTTFDKSIERLNTIISDPEVLKDEVKNYYDTCSVFERMCLEPYSGRIMRKLYSFGLVPSFIKADKANYILNHIECESHRDKIIFALKNRNK